MYEYDPLYRLTEANYSKGDYYHYAYDAVGNRLTQDTQVDGLPLTTTYLYDDANRLTSVNGVNYTWDNNGNLLSDGVNTYDYDSANRLTSFNGTSSYTYSGLGDRLSQTVNGNTTNYTLDLNTGLTQVLNDGTNRYLYGNGRIAQTAGTGTEYFLSDALGSVRQLTDATGEITLAKSYQPYGDMLASVGSGTSPFAFTGEQQDVSGLTYLRARYYTNGDGRFLTKDTWMGDYNSPLSLNAWNYVNGNPINLTDPSGHMPPPPYRSHECRDTFPIGGLQSRINISYADQNVKLAKYDWLNTYVAAGIAVQCWADKLPLWDKDTSGRGIAQISRLQQEQPYGITIKVGNGENGFGLRCYIPIGSYSSSERQTCPVCFTKDDIGRLNKDHNDPDYFAKNYQLEPIVYLNTHTSNQTDVDLGVMYMKRKIQAVINSCRGKCTTTDIFIAAALGQGSGFPPDEMSRVSNPNAKFPNKLYVIPRDARNIIIDWQAYFDDRDHPRATSKEVARFAIAVQGLNQKGWTLPQEPINWNYISTLR
jgi:RHS repeat-associated protein